MFRGILNESSQKVYHDTSLQSCLDIIKSHGLTFVDRESHCADQITANGIGDLLMTILLIKQKLLSTPVYINLKWYTNEDTYHNPLNFLEFRCKLISNILGANHIPLSAICFINDPTNNIQYITPILYTLKDWNLEFNTPNKKSDLLEGKEYVVFHTKLRMIEGSDCVLIKERLKKLYNMYKTNYNVVLLGEREIVPYKGEEIHKIQTIYGRVKRIGK